ncbi:sensor domain-containing diguanylate cyclase [Peribacillus simplex]|uniref:Sensor domain-containing diguanylate cyclase n=2 Tax=Peribacillus TaxID=2675229 RepID=A0AA90PEE5_9BACI|nr:MULTISPECIES: sensor domain-containing diguanylate cyclase [Peribacillus]MDP1419139.1 sensor domain-containing diguanylate cyclase [Peribacillus simplex]MDP1451832.1 sensor domain-containing diguanylate cyclase [Peribacillus frigoritolerans]
MIQQDINYYKNFDSIATEVLSLLAQTIEVNTFFVSILNPIQSFMIKSFNRHAKLICEGDILPYKAVYCKLVVENGLEPLVIPNLREHELTCSHPATKFIGNGCFMGVPLMNKGEIIGTLCAFDIKPHVFKEYDLILIKSMAALISHTIILEKGIIRDPLSGLYNRHFIYNYFDYHKHKTNDEMAILYIDLDHFKFFNDSFGHDAGDEVIKKAAECFLQSVPEGSHVARIGGDEFIVLLHPSHCEDLMKSTQQKAELLLNHLSTMPIHINGNDHFVSASIGISVYPHNGTEMESLLKKADQSMYMAKESGRKNIQYFHPQ